MTRIYFLATVFISLLALVACGGGGPSSLNGYIPQDNVQNQGQLPKADDEAHKEVAVNTPAPVNTGTPITPIVPIDVSENNNSGDDAVQPVLSGVNPDVGGINPVALAVEPDAPVQGGATGQSEHSLLSTNTPPAQPADYQLCVDNPVLAPYFCAIVIQSYCGTPITAFVANLFDPLCEISDDYDAARLEYCEGLDRVADNNACDRVTALTERCERDAFAAGCKARSDNQAVLIDVCTGFMQAGDIRTYEKGGNLTLCETVVFAYCSLGSDGYDTNRLFHADCNELVNPDNLADVDRRRGAACVAGFPHGFCTEQPNAGQATKVVEYCRGDDFIAGGKTYPRNFNPVDRGCEMADGVAGFDYQARAEQWCRAHDAMNMPFSEFFTGTRCNTIDAFEDIATPYCEGLADPFSEPGCSGFAAFDRIVGVYCADLTDIFSEPRCRNYNSFGQARADWCAVDGKDNIDCPDPVAAGASDDFKEWATTDNTGATTASRRVVETDLDGNPIEGGVKRLILSTTRDTTRDQNTNIVQGPAALTDKGVPGLVPNHIRNFTTWGGVVLLVEEFNKSFNLIFTLDDVRGGTDTENSDDGFLIALSKTTKEEEQHRNLYAGLFSSTDVGGPLTEPDGTVVWDAKMWTYTLHRFPHEVFSDAQTLKLGATFSRDKITFETVDKNSLDPENNEIFTAGAEEFFNGFDVRKTIDIKGVVARGSELLTGSVVYVNDRISLSGTPPKSRGVLTGLVGIDGLVGVFAGDGTTTGDHNFFVGGIVARPPREGCSLNPFDPALRSEPDDPNSTPCTLTHVTDYCSTAARLSLDLTGVGTCRWYIENVAEADSCLAKPFDLRDSVSCRAIKNTDAAFLERLRVAQVRACATASDEATDNAVDARCAEAANYCAARPFTDGCTNITDFVTNFCNTDGLNTEGTLACAGSSFSQWAGGTLFAPLQSGQASAADETTNRIQGGATGLVLGAGVMVSEEDAKLANALTLDDVDGHDRPTDSGFGLAVARVDNTNPSIQPDVQLYTGLLYGTDLPGLPEKVGDKNIAEWDGKIQALIGGDGLVDENGINRPRLSDVVDFTLRIDFAGKKLSSDPILLLARPEGNDWLIFDSAFYTDQGLITSNSTSFTEYAVGHNPIDNDPVMIPDGDRMRPKSTGVPIGGVVGRDGVVGEFRGLDKTVNNNGYIVGGFVAAREQCDVSINLFASVCTGVEGVDVLRNAATGYTRWQQAAVSGREVVRTEQILGVDTDVRKFIAGRVGQFVVDNTPAKDLLGAHYVDVGDSTGLTEGGLNLLREDTSQKIHVITLDFEDIVNTAKDPNRLAVGADRRLPNRPLSGVSFARGLFKAKNEFAYAGLLSRTSDLGEPITAVQDTGISPTGMSPTAPSPTGLWEGAASVFSAEGFKSAIDYKFQLTVDYGAKTIKTAVGGYPLKLGKDSSDPGNIITHTATLHLNAKYNNIGIIYGLSSVTSRQESSVNSPTTASAAGSVTGLIGNWGAVGVFTSDPVTTEQNFGIGYAGGFVVRPKVYVIERACDPVDYPFEDVCDEEEDITTARGAACAKNFAADARCALYLDDYCEANPFAGPGCDGLPAALIAAFRYNWCADSKNNHDDCPTTGSSDFKTWAVSTQTLTGADGEDNENLSDRQVSGTATVTKTVMQDGDEVEMEVFTGTTTKFIRDPARQRISADNDFEQASNLIRVPATGLTLGASLNIAPNTKFTLRLRDFYGASSAASGFAFAQADNGAKTLYTGLLSTTDVGTALMGTAETTAVWRGSLRVLNAVGTAETARIHALNDFVLNVSFGALETTFTTDNLLVIDGTVGSQIARSFFKFEGRVAAGEKLLSGSVLRSTHSYDSATVSEVPTPVYSGGVLTGLMGQGGLVGVFASDGIGGSENYFVGGLVALDSANIVTGYRLWRGQPNAEPVVAGAAAEADVDENGVVSLSKRLLRVQEVIVDGDQLHFDRGDQPGRQTYFLNGTNITQTNLEAARTGENRLLSGGYLGQRFRVEGYRVGGIAFGYGLSQNRYVGYAGLLHDTDDLGGVIPRPLSEAGAVADWRGQISLANRNGLVSNNDLRLKVDYFNRTIKTTAITTLTGIVPVTGSIDARGNPTWADVSINAAFDARGLVFGRTTVHGNTLAIGHTQFDEDNNPIASSPIRSRDANLTGIIGRRGLAAVFNIQRGTSNALVGGLVATPRAPAAGAAIPPNYRTWLDSFDISLPDNLAGTGLAPTDYRDFAVTGANNQVVDFTESIDQYRYLLRLNQVDFVDTNQHSGLLSGVSIHNSVRKDDSSLTSGGGRYFAVGLTQGANVGAPIPDNMAALTVRWDARLGVLYGRYDVDRTDLLDNPELRFRGIFNTDFNFCVDFGARQFFFKSNAQDNCRGGDNNQISESGGNPYVLLKGSDGKDGRGQWDDDGVISLAEGSSLVFSDGSGERGGVLSGIIGQNGALGAFIGNGDHDAYAGGFVARSPNFFVPLPAARADFIAWEDSFGGALLGQNTARTDIAAGTHFIAGSGIVAGITSDGGDTRVDTEFLLLGVDNARAVRLSDLTGITDTSAIAYGSVGEGAQTRYYTGVLSTADVGAPIGNMRDLAYWRGRVAVLAGTGSIDPSVGDFWLEVDFANTDIRALTAGDESGLPDLSIMSAGHAQGLTFSGGWDAGGVITGVAAFTGSDGTAAAENIGTLSGLIGADSAVGVFKSNDLPDEPTEEQTAAHNPYVGGFVAHKDAGAPPVCDRAATNAFAGDSCTDHELYRIARIDLCTNQATAWDANCDTDRREYINLNNNTNLREAARDTACLARGTTADIDCASRTSILTTCHAQTSLTAASDVVGTSTAGCDDSTAFTNECKSRPFTDGCLYITETMDLQVAYCTTNASTSDPLNDACTDGTYTHGGDVAGARLTQCQTAQSRDARCDGVEPFTTACESAPFGDGCLHLNNFAALRDTHCANDPDTRCPDVTRTTAGWAANIRNSDNSGVDITPVALADITAPTAEAKSAFVSGMTVDSEGNLNTDAATGLAGFARGFAEFNYLPFGVLDGPSGGGFNNGGVGYIRVGDKDSYAGILTGTDLGEPVVTDARASTTWRGVLAIIIGERRTRAQGGLTLTFDYTAQTITANAPLITVRGRDFKIAAHYTNKGIIYGEATLTQTTPAEGEGADVITTSTGSVSGLIGSGTFGGDTAQNRAVGAFISDGTSDIADGQGRFAGGFIASGDIAPPPPSCVGIACVNYADWEGSFTSLDAAASSNANQFLATNRSQNLFTNNVVTETTGDTAPDVTYLEFDTATYSGQSLGDNPHIGVGFFNGFYSFNSLVSRSRSFYAGVVGDVVTGQQGNLGEALTGSGTARWGGSFQYQDATQTYASRDFVLEIDFDAGNTITAIVPESGNDYFTLIGSWDANGAITGSVLIGQVINPDNPLTRAAIAGTVVERMANTAVMSGLIGAEGAVGVFISGERAANNGVLTAGTGANGFAGGFVASARHALTPHSVTPPAVPAATAGLVNYATWVASGVTVPVPIAGIQFVQSSNGAIHTAGRRNSDNNAYPFVTTNTLGNQFFEGESIGGDSLAGYAEFSSGAYAYAGILDTTDLGAPLDQTSGELTWHGYISSYLGDGDLTLKITFNGSGGDLDAFPQVGGDVFGAHGTYRYILDGQFNSSGLITGMITQGQFANHDRAAIPTGLAATGRISGIIGKKGAVGVYIIDPTLSYGGFIASPTVQPNPDVNIRDWRRNFAAVYNTPYTTAPTNQFTSDAVDQDLTGAKKTFFSLSQATYNGERLGASTIADSNNYVSFSTGTQGSSPATRYYYGLVNWYVNLGDTLPVYQAGVSPRASVRWGGEFQAYNGANDETDTDFILEVNFETTSISAFVKQDGSNQNYFHLTGQYNSDGAIINGKVNWGTFTDNNLNTPTDARTANGILTGLIGVDGAVGVFVSGTSIDDLAQVAGGSGEFGFSGGFLANDVVAVPLPVTYNTWLGISPAPAATRGESSQFLRATAGGLVGQDDEGAHTFTSLNLKDNGFGGTPTAGDAEDGVAYYLLGSYGYAGVSAGTNLGAPLVNEITNATWNGRMRMARGGSSNLPETDISLTVNFNSGAKTGTITAELRVQAEIERRLLNINGMFDEHGVITGSSDIRELNVGNIANPHTVVNSGSLRGLIGADGAVGVFFGNSGQLDTNGYVGGFVACPQGGC